MRINHTNTSRGFPASFALAFLLMVVLVMAGLAWMGMREAQSAEIIPSVGFTRPVENDDEETDLSAGLAIRSQLFAPILQGEIGASYRTESRFDDQLAVRMWPITASLWLQPVPMLYAGAGVGFYNVTLDYDNDSALGALFDDSTTQEFGVHVGGGLRVPLASKASLDLNGRYVMMRDQEDDTLVPEHFNPDFWSANLGLAIGF